MSQPPRMLVLSSITGYEAFVALPNSFEKAIQVATEKFSVPKTHILRLSCSAADIPWIGGYATGYNIYISDNDSYHYACAGKHVVRLDVHVEEKHPAGGGGGQAEGVKANQPPTLKAAPKTSATLVVQGQVGNKSMAFGGNVTAEDLSKGPPPGNYLGTYSIEPGTFAQTFVGSKLPGDDKPSSWEMHDSSVVRVLFRARGARPKIDVLYPEERSLEVTYNVKDWTITAAYPATTQVKEGNTMRLRWWLRVQPGGIVEDLLTGTESSGLFMELVPSAAPRPSSAPKPDDPLLPWWPDVRPSNAWCVSQAMFIPHIDRLLRNFGLPPESRSGMITSWLPSVGKYSNIAYRILGEDHLAPSCSLSIVPPPQILIRVFVLFRGISDHELKDWSDRTIPHQDATPSWNEAVSYWQAEAMADESLFRVVEYGSMEVHLR